MKSYRATVTIEFDDEDLQGLAETLGADNINPHDALNGALDNLDIGVGIIETMRAVED